MNLPSELRRGLPTTRDFIWAVVDQDLSGVSRLIPVRLSSRDDGERAFGRIRDRLALAKSPSWICRMSTAISFKTVASTATIKYVSLTAMSLPPICKLTIEGVKRRTLSRQSNLFEGISRG